MTDFLIRPIYPEEADALHALTQAAYAEYSETAAPSTATQETVRDVRDRLWSGAFRAAVAERADGTLMGAVRYRLDSDGLYFFRLAVHPEHRRLGVARALLAWLEQEAVRWQAQKLRCQVRLIVPRNVELYLSAGFSVVSQHTVIRGTTEVPVATMEKRLLPSPSFRGEGTEESALIQPEDICEPERAACLLSRRTGFVPC